MSDDHAEQTPGQAGGIVYPVARCTIEHGLDEDGHEVTVECWENLADPSESVSMLTRAGLLTMAQQTLTWLAIGGDEDEDEDL